MGRKRNENYQGTDQERAAQRKRASRQRQRLAAGKPAVLTPEQQREQDRREDAGVVSSIRAMLVKRGRADLADRMYPQGHRQRGRV